MYKKRLLVLFAVWFVSHFYLLTAEGADAFCVYNNRTEFSQETMVEEVQGIYKQSTRETTCSTGKTRTVTRKGRKAVLKVHCRFTQVDMITFVSTFRQGSGWLSVSGDSKRPYKCEAYFDETGTKTATTDDVGNGEKRMHRRRFMH